jgi:simple sugar transport system permease protein
MDFIIKILFDSLYFSGPIILIALGGLFAYKAGIVNIGLDGFMLFGALASTLILYFTKSWALALLGGIVIGILLGVLFSFFGVTKKANFIITGFAIGLLSTAAGKYALALMHDTSINVIGILSTGASRLNIPLIEDIPFLGPIISGHTYLTYFAYISIFLVGFIMKKTKFGTYVRVVGESEEAARSVGININRIKYLAVIIGGIFTALAGYEVAVVQLSSYTTDITAGMGFIALAAIYCGDGDPGKVSVYAILFGVAQALSVNLAIRIGSIAGLLKIIPYITIVIVLFVVALIKNRKSLYRGFIYE